MNPSAPPESQAPVMAPPPVAEMPHQPPVYPGMTPIPTAETQGPINPQAIPPMPNLHEFQLNFNHGATSPDQASAPDQKQQTMTMEQAGALGQPQNLDNTGINPGSEPPIDYSKIPAAPTTIPATPSPIAYSEIPTTPVAQVPTVETPPPQDPIMSPVQPEVPAYAQVSTPTPPPPMSPPLAPAETPPTYVSVPAAPVTSPPPAEKSFASMTSPEPITPGAPPVPNEFQEGLKDTNLDPTKPAEATEQNSGSHEVELSPAHAAFKLLNDFVKAAEFNPDIQQIGIDAANKIADNIVQSATATANSSTETNK